MGVTLDAVYAMPASEFLGWQAYFEIYPFSEERQDARFAMLATVIANISGKTLKHSLKEKDFMPDYLNERNRIVPDKSLEEQRLEFVAFKEQLQAAQAKVQ